MIVPKSIVKPECDIDPAFLDRLSSMGGDQLVAQLIEMYFKRSAELIQTIQTGLESTDFESVKNAAHSLISSSGNLGGQIVSYLSKLIEHFALEQAQNELDGLIRRLEHSQAAFLEYLKKDLENR